MTKWGYDIPVTGNIVGNCNDVLYTFHSHDKWGSIIAQTHAGNDDEAVSWFKTNYQAEFTQGVEMRAHDRKGVME